MTLTRKSVGFFVCSSLILSLVATALVAQGAYRQAIDKLAAVAAARVEQRPEIPWFFYREQHSSLQYFLHIFLEQPAVTAAVAYSSIGTAVAETGMNGTSTERFPALASIRGDASVTDTTLTALDEANAPSGTHFWSMLFSGKSKLYLTIPVFLPVDSAAPNLKLEDFATAMNRAQKNGSRVVIGYIQLAINPAEVMAVTRTTAIEVFFSTLFLMILTSISFLLIVRRDINSLNQLKQLASQILSGSKHQTGIVLRSDEYLDIGTVLNNVMQDSTDLKQEVDLEHKLALMKADQKATQLSEREQELSRATEEINATREQLHRLANYDRLTSLPNRQLFTEQLGLLLRLCARNAKPLALLFINLDNFHRINELLGRSSGDLLLQEVAKRLSGCLRTSDVLAHYVNPDDQMNISRVGGDEFAIAPSQLDQIEAASLIAQRVKARLLEPMIIDSQELVVNPSIGIALAPRNSMDAEELLSFASAAMHHAKMHSSEECLVYSEEMEASGQDDLKLESELRKAIDRNELRLHYQPQVDTSDGSIICAEALLRWEHPELGSVSPTRFISLAERTGLIWELGDWALVEACRQMKDFRDQGLLLPRIAINISPQQFKPVFISRLQEVLRASELPGSALELGLSEAILMENDSGNLKFLQELKDVGVYLSLENFGTSHAPITYLSRHPLDEIKIDRSFVADCDKRREHARLVQAIIAMANSLSLRTVAEGVETEGEYRFLANNGVGVMRGYLFSKPLPAAELQRLLVVPWHFMSQIQRMALLSN
ncbi:MAG: EAL domain-containing protein [Halioglobus sp.]